MTIDEMIAVLQAHKNGKVIQYKNTKGNWFDYENPPTNFWQTSGIDDYRVKREPREWWLYPSSTYGTATLLASTLKYQTGDAAVEKPIHVREVID